jgi:predicted Rossmann fold nucleotide-binding protein DprA/Smf involved in DNA uptake
MTVTIQEATDQLIQAIREDMLAKLTGGLASKQAKADPIGRSGLGSIADRVYAFVRVNNGFGRGVIAKGLGLEPSRVTTALAMLRKQGKVKATGTRRFATWHAVK